MNTANSSRGVFCSAVAIGTSFRSIAQVKILPRDPNELRNLRAGDPGIFS